MHSKRLSNLIAFNTGATISSMYCGVAGTLKPVLVRAPPLPQGWYVVRKKPHALTARARRADATPLDAWERSAGKRLGHALFRRFLALLKNPQDGAKVVELRDLTPADLAGAWALYIDRAYTLNLHRIRNPGKLLAAAKKDSTAVITAGAYKLITLTYLQLKQAARGRGPAAFPQ